MDKTARSNASQKPTLNRRYVSLRPNIKNDASKNFAQTHFFQGSTHITLGKYAFLRGPRPLRGVRAPQKLKKSNFEVKFQVS